MAVSYCIDADDRITHWSGDYALFALENDGAEIADRTMEGRSLWDFIDDSQTKLVYRSLIERARDGNEATFNFRCDGPRVKRHLAMTISGNAAGSVCFTINTIAVSPRDHQALLDRRTLRSNEIVPFCSWCNRIRVSLESWHEVEDAVEMLRLFEEERMPRLDYVMCDSCYGSRSRL